VGELDGGVQVVCEVNPVKKIPLRESCRTNAIINVATVEFRSGTKILLPHFIFQMSHEEASIAGTHLRPHRYTTDLMKDLPVEIKCVQGQNKFS
jgi:hypothetical protein